MDGGKTIRLKIVSDGRSANTHVLPLFDENEGVALRGVQEISWHLKLDGLAEATIRLHNVEVDVQAPRGTIITDSKPA